MGIKKRKRLGFKRREKRRKRRAKLKAAGKNPAVGDHVILGLTKASLNTDSNLLLSQSGFSGL